MSEQLNRRLLEEVEQHGLNYRGRKEILAYYEGKPLNASQAIKAKCYSCTGYYADGRGDCETPSCPLYGHMHFNKNKNKKTVVRTEAQKAASVDRLKKFHAEKQNQPEKSTRSRNSE